MKPARLSLIALAALLPLAACSDETPAEQGAPEQAVEDAASAAVETFRAEPASAVPLGSVPATVTLPPEARVAVTSPFPGAAVRVFVIEGQGVSRGQPLALVRAAEPLRIGADLARAQSAVQLAEARSARLAQLAEEGIVAQARADEALAELEQARVTLAENRRLASYAGVGPDGTMTLRAPIGGRVAHVGVEAGGPIDQMNAPFVIEAAGSYLLDLQLPERLAGEVRPGMAVEVRVPAGDGEMILVGGSIISVAPSIDPQTRSVMAKARIGAGPGLVAGQNVMAVIVGQSDLDGAAIPARAVTRIDGQDHVFVLAGKGFAPRPVTIASIAGDRAVISEGIEPGDVVATGGIAELKAAAAE